MLPRLPSLTDYKTVSDLFDPPRENPVTREGAMASALQRELSVWADFNSFDGERRITATLRFAKSPERPVEGELVRLYDSEGNTVMGVVERIEGMTLHVRPEMATWSSSDVSLHSPFAGETPFRAAPQGEPVT